MKILNTLKASWSSEEIRKRIIITVLIIVAFRILAAVPIPGINPDAIRRFYSSEIGGALQFLNTFTGGTLDNISILSVGLVPFINASVIFQLLPTIVKRLEQMQKEGEQGRKRLTQYTRLLTVPLSVLTAITIFISLSSGSSPVIVMTDPLRIVATISILSAGAIFMMWLGEIATEKGIGNGISILIMVGILAAIPSRFLAEIMKFQNVNEFIKLAVFTVLMIVLVLVIAYLFKVTKDVKRLFIKLPLLAFSMILTAGIIILYMIPIEIANYTNIDKFKSAATEFAKIKETVPVELGLILGGVTVIIGFIVIFNEAAKNLPIYFSRKASTSASVARKSFMPLKILQAGVMPIIFSSALLLFPFTLAKICIAFKVPVDWIQNSSNSIISFLGPEDWRFWTLNFVFTAFFAYFYTFVLFRPNQVADNLKKGGSYVPGIRPGIETEKYLTKTMLHLVFAGAMVLGIMSTAQAFTGGSGLLGNVNSGQQKSLLSTVFTSGTSLLIVVGVALDTRRQFKSYLAQRNYEALIDDMDDFNLVDAEGEIIEKKLTRIQKLKALPKKIVSKNIKNDKKKETKSEVKKTETKKVKKDKKVS
ncbi:MAG: preprotein translocase subunit SecY [bacterium]